MGSCQERDAPIYLAHQEVKGSVQITEMQQKCAEVCYQELLHRAIATPAP